MTISQKIIVSSTLVAILAALAAFMGWNNTQPIQKGLVKTLTHTTEEIRFLDDIKVHVNEIELGVQKIVRALDNQEVSDLKEYFDKGRLLDTRTKALKVQIKAFEEFNRTADSEELIGQMLLHCESLSENINSLFRVEGELPTSNIAFRAGANSKKIVDRFDTMILDVNHQRYVQIKKEGEKVQAQISKLNFWIILVGGLTFLMAIVFGRVIASNLSAEFEKLRGAADRLNKGDYSARVGLNSNDEFGKLGKTFDGMAANLEQAKTIEQQKIEMEQLNEALKIKNDALDRFVYRVSHDLKAPVVNIISLLKLLKIKIGKTDDSEASQSFFFLEKSSAKLQQTISDLLEVSRIERSLESSKEWVNFDTLLSQIITENKENIVNHQVTISSDFKVPELYFSTANLDSILSNFITNSIKYCSTTQAPEIHLETKREEAFVCLIIKDNGVGIDLEKHSAKLFGMFNRFHNHVEGSGVGLYIVKKIVEDSGGKIEVESEVGVGTTFKVYFAQQEVPVSGMSFANNH